MLLVAKFNKVKYLKVLVVPVTTYYFIIKSGWAVLVWECASEVLYHINCRKGFKLLRIAPLYLLESLWAGREVNAKYLAFCPFSPRLFANKRGD